MAGAVQPAIDQCAGGGIRIPPVSGHHLIAVNENFVKPTLEAIELGRSVGNLNITLLALTVACVAYFGFYREGCVCPIGATQNVTLALFDTGADATGLIRFIEKIVFSASIGRRYFASSPIR